LKKDYEAEKAKTKPSNDIGNLISAAVSYTKNRKRALIMAIHIATFRQFSGANVLVTFSTQIMEAFTGPNSFARFTGLIINLIQLLANAISLFTFAKEMGRRTLFLFGAICLTIFNFGIALSLFFSV
jgi:hypothetical protein